VRGRRFSDDGDGFERPELQVGCESQDERRGNAIGEKGEQNRQHPVEGTLICGVVRGGDSPNDRGDDQGRERRDVAAQRRDLERTVARWAHEVIRVYEDLRCRHSREAIRTFAGHRASE